MNFADAKHIRDLIWYDGPLLSVMEHKDKTYLVKWVDVNDARTVHTWIIFEVEPAILEAYYAKVLTLRQLEERSANVYFFEGFLEESDAAWVDIDEVPEDWKARSNSYFDERLVHND